MASSLAQVAVQSSDLDTAVALAGIQSEIESISAADLIGNANNDVPQAGAGDDAPVPSPAGPPLS